ncbi:MAG: GNAT family N-acetyltransferase [Nocardiopsaceae bacterium]|nr:GNAT family N-acetyltransferase [Nocardiopsaceae bacterium]
MTATEPVQTMPAAALATERLTLRTFTEGDIEDVYTGITDPDTQRWLPLPRPGAPYTRADAREWCLVLAPESRASGDGQHWAVVETETAMFVGSFGLTRTMWKAHSTEIGYWVAPWARGRGFATEAVIAISRWALTSLGFQRVELKAAAGNTASRRVAEKSGFGYEGTERNAMPLHRGRTDLAVYSLIPSDLER